MSNIKIYSLNISEVSSEDFTLWYSQMDEERKSSVDRLQNEDKRRSKIAADALCRKAISENCNVPCSDIVFGKTEKGKPFTENADVHFNISHSGDIVVCAVSDKEIGTDIEKIRRINPRAAEKFASGKELEYIASADNGFFRIWTLKEAYFKCIGTGLGADIKNVSFSIDGKQIRCSENGFICFAEDLHKDYICSVCIKE